MKKFYGVKKGICPGVYSSWAEAKAQIDGYSGAEYKGFPTKKEAEDFCFGSQKEEAFIEGLCAYVDGSFRLETMDYSYGVVLLQNGKVLETLNGVGTNEEAAKMRNVAGELKGAMIAMNYAVKNGYDALTIFHDYEGIGKWAENKWKANLPATKSYQEYVKQIKTKLKLTFVKVLAHSGVEYNEMADELAKAAFLEKQ